jgi:ribosome-associated protein
MNAQIHMIVDSLSEKKADTIRVVAYPEGTHPVMDYGVIVSARNSIHINVLKDTLYGVYKSHKQDAGADWDFLGQSGTPDSQWVIMDFNHIVVHIMTQLLRDQYDFDKLFADAENYRYY